MKIISEAKLEDKIKENEEKKTKEKETKESKEIQKAQKRHFSLTNNLGLGRNSIKYEQTMESYYLDTESQIIELEDENNLDDLNELNLKDKEKKGIKGEEEKDSKRRESISLNKIQKKSIFLNSSNNRSRLSFFQRKSKRKRLGTMCNIEPSEIKDVFNIKRKCIEIKRPPSSYLITLRDLYSTCTKMKNSEFIRHFNFSYENEKIKAKEKVNELYFSVEKQATSSSNKSIPNYSHKFQSNFNLTSADFNKQKENYFEEKNFERKRISISKPRNSLKDSYKIELFNNLRINEKQQIKLEKKLNKIKKKEDVLNIKKNDRNDFSMNIMSGLQQYIDMKREDDILKYDYITKIDNGLVFKETLRENIMHKLIPGNYMYQNKPLKFEVFHPKFVKTKFCMGKNQIAAGKPIVKGSDHSLKEYCNYYNKKGDLANEKNAFSIMNII